MPVDAVACDVDAVRLKPLGELLAIEPVAHHLGPDGGTLRLIEPEEHLGDVAAWTDPAGMRDGQVL